MSNAAKKLIAILLLTLVALFISLPKEIPIKINLIGTKIDKTFTRPDLNINFGKVSIHKNFDLVLGLDLAGGSHLVFEADLSGIEAERRETAISGVRNVIERRVNLFGVSEPNIQISTFEGKERINVELPGVNNTKDEINLIGRVAFLTFAEVEGEGDKQTLKTTNLTGADLKSAMVVFDQTTGKPAVSLEFTSEGANKFEDLTGKNVGEPLPILLDGQLVSSPVVQEKISGGNAQITGTFTLDEAKNLAIQLNAGALPVPIKLVEERTVGATLGNESIKKSLMAGIIGAVLVALFMIAYYRLLGLVSALSLNIYLII